MSSLNSFGADNSHVIFEKNPGEIFPNQQESFNRIFLYLNALHVPKEKARELALEALKRAGNSSSRDAAIPDAMRALRGLLTDHLPLTKENLFSQHAPSFHENLSGVKSMPPVNRGSMVPAPIDLIPWRTFLVRSLKKAIIRVSRPLNFLILFIFLIIVFILITFWK